MPSEKRAPVTDKEHDDMTGLETNPVGWSSLDITPGWEVLAATVQSERSLAYLHFMQRM